MRQRAGKKCQLGVARIIHRLIKCIQINDDHNLRHEFVDLSRSLTITLATANSIYAIEWTVNVAVT